MRGLDLTAGLAALAARVRGEDPERGDVPGWVMITVMTAALVLAILVPFRAAIVDAVTTALSSVTSGGWRRPPLPPAARRWIPSFPPLAGSGRCPGGGRPCTAATGQR